MVEDGKYEFFPWGKVSFSKLIAFVRQEFFVEKKLYRLGGIPQCSYSNIVPNVEELEKLKLTPNSFVSDHPDTSLMPSTKNPEQRSYQVNLPHVSTDHDSFDDFSTMPLYLERVMNDRFTDILKSLQSKNETVEKENVTKESHKEGHHSDDVADFEGNSDPGSLNFVMEKPHKMETVIPPKILSMLRVKLCTQSSERNDKSVEMEEDKVNQAPSPFTSCEQQEKDDGIEKLSDITVEEIKPINIIFLVQEHEMTLTIYKPPSPTPDEYMISDTAIVSAFPTPIKTVSEVKKTPS
ncbi:hypothetical protein FXO37_04428 [Capsicum annuum]|nr:hypothetical protein FXO37_04428 [Capsicum annuum]